MHIQVNLKFKAKSTQVVFLGQCKYVLQEPPAQKRHSFLQERILLRQEHPPPVIWKLLAFLKKGLTNKEKWLLLQPNFEIVFRLSGKNLPGLLHFFLEHKVAAYKMSVSSTSLDTQISIHTPFPWSGEDRRLITLFSLALKCLRTWMQVQFQTGTHALVYLSALRWRLEAHSRDL